MVNNPMLKCPKCGHPISELAMRRELARLMNLRKPAGNGLSPEQAREFGRKGALKRWGAKKSKETPSQ
jgi:hypothetical protein